MVKIYTRKEMLKRAEDISQETLGVNYQKALEMLDSGELDGKLIEVVLKSIRFMLN